MNNSKKFNRFSFFNKKISTSTGIFIIIAVAVLFISIIISQQQLIIKKAFSLGDFPKITRISSSPLFAYKRGTDFMFNGEAFRFIGFNRFGAANDDAIFSCGPSGEKPDIYLDKMFNNLKNQAGVKVIRFWAFQSYTKGGTDWSAIDRVLNFAEKYGIRVILVLENQWPDCTQGDYKYNVWYKKDYLLPYGTYSLSYKDYVKELVLRYRDRPTILMWQLMNEAESKDKVGNCDPISLYNFASDMSAFVKTLDQNHLVSLGTIGTGQCGTKGEEYVRLHAIPTIDVVEAHDYGQEEEALPSFIAADLQVAKDLNKPFFIGEAGISKDTHTLDERSMLFDAKIKVIWDKGGGGYLLWQWDNSVENFGTSCSGFDEYCFTFDDPLILILKKYSE